MLELIGLKEDIYCINTNLIERIDFFKDTIVHLTDSRYYVVKDTIVELLEKINFENRRQSFLSVSRQNGREFLLNLKLIEKIEFVPETKITMITGHYYNVDETKEEIENKLKQCFKYVNMIEVTGIHSNKVLINDSLIERIQESAETRITIINKNFYFVKDTQKELIDKISQGETEALSWIALDNVGYVI